MIRARSFCLVALLAAACSGAADKPGALLRGPGALAVFDGVAEGRFRPYLAVASERGDELRLVDLVDNEVVPSPGLVFPLSVPTAGRPMWVAAADLNDGDLPDALAVVAAGSDVIEIVDTWSGFPSVVASVPLAADGEVLALVALAVPDALTPGDRAVGEARLVVGLTGGRLEVIELTRGAGDAIVATKLASPLGGLPFDVSSLSPGADPGVVYAGSLDGNPGFGVAKIALPRDLTGWSAAGPGTVRWFDTGAPIQGVAAVTFGFWDFATDSFGADVERVIAVPVPSECGPGKAVRCGLLAVDPLAEALAAAWIPAAQRVPSDESFLIPLPIPAPVTQILATGRSAGALMPLASAAGTASTSGLAAVAAADGGIYLVDLARWAVASETHPLVGGGRTRVSAASVVASGGSEVGLDDGTGGTVDPALLPARVQVTPGFTPDEEWTLTWQGILPGLDSRGATFVRSGTQRRVTLAADLGALGVEAGDVVVVSGIEAFCPSGTELVTAAAGAGGAVEVVVPPGNCLEAVPDAAAEPMVVTFRASELALVGKTSGLVGRPTADVEFTLDGVRQFYVTDACASAECVAAWPGLSFPFPLGPSLRLTAAFVPSGTPARGTSLHFTTKSGLAPTKRIPISGGSAVAAELPSGLAIRDPGTAGTAPTVHASYTAGLVTIFSTGDGAGSMTLIR